MVVAKVIGSAVGGLVIGFGLSWWLTREPPPWLEFNSLEASYRLGSVEILIDGKYDVIRECDHGIKPVIWRTEALATDGQIAVYGPKPDAPPLTVGEHEYHSTLTLLAPIDPDGWVLRSIVSCSGAYPETVASPAAVIRIID